MSSRTMTMPTTTMIRMMAVLLGVVFFLLPSGGCASSGEKMANSFQRTRTNVAESRAQVSDTLSALRIVRTSHGDGLKNAYKHYKKSVGDLEKAGGEAKSRALALKEQADTHIKAWQAEQKNIKDPAIKASVESRRSAVRSNFALVQMYSDDVRKAYEPFISGNKDIVQALSIDLSPAAATSLAPSIDQVSEDGKALDQKLWMLQRALDNIAAGVSPLGAPEQAAAGMSTQR
jgi:hypothetical protein